MKRTLSTALIAAALMASAAAAAMALTPREKIVDLMPKLDLERVIPEQFGEWQMDKRAVGGVVNPQQTEVLNQIYTQIVTRTYVSSRGYRIMLSIAYGEDQRDSNQLHYPEVCYPAQGFQVTSNRRGVLETKHGEIPVKRLESQISQQRFEPITYWTTVGNQTHVGSVSKKFAELKYGLRGQIPDGLLFRVSSIDRDSANAFRQHEAFIDDLIPVLDADMRARVAGL